MILLSSESIWFNIYFGSFTESVISNITVAAGLALMFGGSPAFPDIYNSSSIAARTQRAGRHDAIL
jgi:hypothetical protein